MRFQRFAAAATTAVAVAAGLAVATPTAQATTLNACRGSQDTTYHPPIQPAPRQTTVHADGAFGNCLGDPTHTGGTYSADAQGELSCLLGGSSTGTGKLFWADTGAGTSTFTFTLAAGLRPVLGQVLIATGTITGGDYQGASIEIVYVLTTTDVTACLTTGIDHTFGDMLITIIG